MKNLILAAVLIFFIGCGSEDQNLNECQDRAEVEKKAIVEPEFSISSEKEIKDDSVKKVRSAQDIYKVCSGCHGENAQKSALGRSQIIRGWDDKKIENALQGYKNGTYGASMKAVMQAQAYELSEEEIEILAKYISKL